MSQIIITEGASEGLECCRLFLMEKTPNAAIRSAQAIKHSFALLQTEPGLLILERTGTHADLFN